MLPTHLSTVATIGDTVTAAVVAVAASIAILVATLFHLEFDRVASLSIEFDGNLWTLIALIDA